MWAYLAELHYHYLCYVCLCLVIYCHTVSRSSAKIEYRSMEMIVCEFKWPKQLLHDVLVIVARPILIHCDSHAAISTLLLIQFFLNAPSTLRLIVTLCVMLLGRFHLSYYLRIELQLVDLLTNTLHPTQFHFLAQIGHLAPT